MGILSGRGAYEGSKRERKGYQDARKTLEALKPEIQKAQKMMDPWSDYRGQYTEQLHGILQGERDWTTDPGYQFRVAEDERAVERAAAARGSNISGNVLTELASRRQQMASQEYSNVINRLIGLAAATPENAIAGGQMYANAMTQIAMGQAQAEIGSGFAQSRGIAAGHAGIEDTAYSLMNYFIPGGNFGSGGNSAAAIVGGGGGGGGGSIGGQATSFGGLGTNLTGWGGQSSNLGASSAGGFGGMGTNLTGWGGQASNLGAIGSSSFVGGLF